LSFTNEIVHFESVLDALEVHNLGSDLMKNDALFDAIDTDRIRRSWPSGLTEEAVIAKIVEARAAPCFISWLGLTSNYENGCTGV
jgi:hypothetical protein